MSTSRVRKDMESPPDARDVLRSLWEELGPKEQRYVSVELERDVLAIIEEPPIEDAEMWCNRCERRHGVVWFAPSDLWNDVMREGDRGNPDEFSFCCPTCFMQLADERGVGVGMWVVAANPGGGPYPTMESLFGGVERV